MSQSCNGRNSDQTVIDESWYRKPAGIRERLAAGGVIIRQENDQCLVGFIREGDQKSYSLPKGKLEKDESPEQAAIREIEEEAGLTNLNNLGSLCIRERLDYRKKHWKITQYFLFLTDQVTGKPTDEKHIYLLEWFPLDRLPGIYWPEQRELLENNMDRIRNLVKTKQDG